MSQAGLRREKCVFLDPSVVYLRHKIDAQVLHLVVEKVEAIRKAPRPRNVTELKSYLGLLSYRIYYFHFFPTSQHSWHLHTCNRGDRKPHRKSHSLSPKSC